ncbi:hypothetical protein [Montanilutibacter psychrotolerans]|nr:hypothetical protein [Lysobacter psychrotolerans]
MQAFLAEALAAQGFRPSAILPDDRGAPVHVGVLKNGDEADAIKVVFVVSQFDAFTPLAITDLDAGKVADPLLAAIAQSRGPDSWAIGRVYDVVGSDYLAARDVTGLLLLAPETANLFLDLTETMTLAGQAFALRLAIYLKGDETRAARADLVALLDEFDATGRDIFLLEAPAPEGA